LERRHFDYRDSNAGRVVLVHAEEMRRKRLLVDALAVVVQVGVVARMA